jgi:DMSO/TMAO reductase YedYZ molybdopterin-dependent catalytic subunit
MNRRLLPARSAITLLLVGLLLSFAGCQKQPTLSGLPTTGPDGTAGTTANSEATNPTFTLSTTDVRSSATLSRYRTNEIREYEGARLDPAVGPRDNSIAGVQSVDIDTYRLTIDGLVRQDRLLTYAEVQALAPELRLITLYCVEGWQATILWQGVLLDELIGLAEALPQANTVIFHAHDGYTTSLPLDTIRSRALILAYQANQLPLPPEMGYPFIVVAEAKQGYKWARWVTRIELTDDPSYRGFWESRGFDNDAELD